MPDAPTTSPTPAADPASKSMDDIVALCKRRGFVYPASEIYGGINGFWDYGPLGTALKNNIRDHWWRRTVEAPPLGPDGNPVEVVGLDSAIIQNPKTWEASGHVGGFSDPRVDCKECKSRFRADHVRGIRVTFTGAEGVFWSSTTNTGMDAEADTQRFIDRLIDKKAEKERPPVFTSTRVTFHPLDDPATPRAEIPCPACKTRGSLMEPRQFNLMFESETGAVSGETMKVYLRPETAQGIFLNFKNVVDTMRVKMPFGIAQIGKSFRNEVTPRNFIFRSREFEQMEMEWFCAPDEAPQWYDFWKHERMKWWESLGIDKSSLRFRDHDHDELAHYSKMCVDVEYQYPFTAPGFGELEGIAHRGDFDLTQHQQHSGQKLEYFDQERQVALQNQGVDKEEIRARSRYIPNVIEPASGLTRAVLVLLCEAYTPDASRPSGMYMKFHPRMAPITAGIFPLVNKDGMPEVAQNLYMNLREKFAVQLDVKQNIGKRYARMDEAGAPFCFTIDGNTLSDQTLTVRHRDTQAQERIGLDHVERFLAEHVEG